MGTDYILPLIILGGLGVGGLIVIQMNPTPESQTFYVSLNDGITLEDSINLVRSQTIELELSESISMNDEITIDHFDHAILSESDLWLELEEERLSNPEIIPTE